MKTKISILFTPTPAISGGLIEQERDMNRVLSEDIVNAANEGWKFDHLSVIKEYDNGAIKFSVVYVKE